jgi:hypothetical protein
VTLPIIPAREEGKAEGEMKGKAEGEAEGVLVVLRARGLVVSPEVEDRETHRTDVAQLDEWLRRAVVVASAEEIFGGRATDCTGRQGDSHAHGGEEAGHRPWLPSASSMCASGRNMGVGAGRESIRPCVTSTGEKPKRV